MRRGYRGVSPEAIARTSSPFVGLRRASPSPQTFIDFDRARLRHPTTLPSYDFDLPDTNSEHARLAVEQGGTGDDFIRAKAGYEDFELPRPVRKALVQVKRYLLAAIEH